MHFSCIRRKNKGLYLYIAARIEKTKNNFVLACIAVTITDSRMRNCVNYRVETGANKAQSRQKRFRSIRSATAISQSYFKD